MGAGWNVRAVVALESIAASLTKLEAVVSDDGIRMRTLSLTESASTTTTTAAPTTTTTAGD